VLEKFKSIQNYYTEPLSRTITQNHYTEPLYRTIIQNHYTEPLYRTIIQNHYTELFSDTNHNNIEPKKIPTRTPGIVYINTILFFKYDKYYFVKPITI